MVTEIQNIIVRHKTACHIGLLCLIVFTLSTKGITDENIVALLTDMPKYLMNGVYFYDLTRDLPVKNFFDHAYRYFAQYPSLSLGHHPLLLGLAQIPFYAVFGVSVFSARMCVLFFMLLGAISMYLLVRRLYGNTIGLLSTSLFITTPFVVQYSRVVMSEIPTMSLILLSMYLLFEYCESEKKLYIYAFAMSFTLSMYSKHTAIFMVPVYFVCFVMNMGFKNLLRKEVLIALILMTVLIAPLVPLTLKFSQINMWVVYEPISEKFKMNLWLGNIQNLWSRQLTLPVIILSLISILYSLYKRDKLSLLFLLWIVLCYILVVYIGKINPRYSIYRIPIFCLFAATALNIFSPRKWKIIILSVLITTIGYQLVKAYNEDNKYAYGYEEAAKYIVENKKGDSVLYGNVHDTGYFIYFIRKYDKNRDMIVLRSDKLFATSAHLTIVEDRIKRSKEIYEALHDYGVKYVLIEDTEAPSPALELFRNEVKSSSKFKLIKVVSIKSSHPAADNVPLCIYEYRNYRPSKGDKMLDMNIPLMGDSIRIPFKELKKKSYPP